MRIPLVQRFPLPNRVMLFIRGWTKAPLFHCAISVRLSPVSPVVQLTNPPELVFIYSCPAGSQIRDRMVYSSGVSSTYAEGKLILNSLSPPIAIASRKIETASPEDLNEAYLRDELESVSPSNDERETERSKEKQRDGQETRLFAKPRGPGRRR